MEDFISIQDSFSVDQLFQVSTSTLPWFVDYNNFLLGQVLHSDSSQQKKKFLNDVTYYYWVTLTCLESVIIRSLKDVFQKKEMLEILYHCHTFYYGGYFRRQRIAMKV